MCVNDLRDAIGRLGLVKIWRLGLGLVKVVLGLGLGLVKVCFVGGFVGGVCFVLFCFVRLYNE